jgi:hypothetical protein
MRIGAKPTGSPLSKAHATLFVYGCLTISAVPWAEPVILFLVILSRGGLV